jgi:cell division protein FtsW
MQPQTIPDIGASALGKFRSRVEPLGAAMPGIDRWLWLSAMGLMAIGTIMVLSSSVMLADRQFGAPGYFWKRQLIWWGLAAFAMFALSRIDHRQFKRMRVPVLAGAFVLLVVVLYMEPVNGARRWLTFGIFRFQPAEFFRLSMILYTAGYLARRGDEIASPLKLLPLIGVLAAGTLLLLKQPEFSGVLTMWAIIGIMLFAAGARWLHMLLAVSVAVIVACVVVFGLGYKTARVEEWHAGLFTDGGSYQVQQSKIALGSGGLFGQGLGKGRAKMLFLPEPHTDFILASIGEELGLIGLTGVLALVAVMIFRGWRAAARAPDRFGYFLVIGIGGSLMVNAGLNAAVATGLLPATGLPFPFVSYGGSSLLVTAASWGIVLNVSRFRASQWRS